MVDLIVFPDHVVFQLALGGQDADFPQQRRGLVRLYPILAAAVQQRVDRRLLYLRGRFLFALLHFYALLIDRDGH